MAIMGLAVPHATARLFSEIDVPGTREPTSSMHITLLYVGKQVPIEVIADAVKATYAVTSQTKPFTVRASRVMSFPINPDDEDGHPVIARVESDALHDFRRKLAASFDDAGIEFSKKFPDYKPHVTLAYAPEAVEEFTIPTIEWGAHEVVLWGGDEGDGRILVTFPLALKPSRDAALIRRVAMRFTTGAASRGRPTNRG